MAGIVSWRERVEVERTVLEILCNGHWSLNRKCYRGKDTEYEDSTRMPRKLTGSPTSSHVDIIPEPHTRLEEVHQVQKKSCGWPPGGHAKPWTPLAFSAVQRVEQGLARMHPQIEIQSVFTTIPSLRDRVLT